MLSSKRSCPIDLDNFCCLCGQFKLAAQRGTADQDATLHLFWQQNLNDFVQNLELNKKRTELVVFMFARIKSSFAYFYQQELFTASK